MTTSKDPSLTKNSLSIQVSLDGLSFFIQDVLSSALVLFKEVRFRESTNPSTLLPQVEEVFLTNEALSQAFTKVTVIYSNELFTVVPQELFNAAKAADYLKFNTKILSTDFIAHDHLELHDLVTVYVPYSNVNNFFFDTFGTFDYYHSNTLFLKHLLEKHAQSEAPTVLVNCVDNHLDVGVVKQKQLLFSNRFEIRTKEDFLYHLLFTLEQLELSTETTEVALTGTIEKGDSFFELAYTYIRNLTIVAPVSKEIPNAHFLLATHL